MILIFLLESYSSMFELNHGEHCGFEANPARDLQVNASPTCEDMQRQKDTKLLD